MKEASSLAAASSEVNFLRKKIHMLEHLFGSRTRIQLLTIFFRDPEQKFYLRELARLTAIHLHAVRREIANLERMGLIHQIDNPNTKQRDTGTQRSKYYQLTQDSLLVPELKALLFKAQLFEEQELIAHIKKQAGPITLFILTGFFTGAAGAPTDLLLVGDIKPMVVARIIHHYEQKIQRSIRYTTMTTIEFQERHEIGDKFLYSIFEAKHLTVVDEITVT